MIPDVTPNGVFYLPPTGWLTSFYNPPLVIVYDLFHFSLKIINWRIFFKVFLLLNICLFFKFLLDGIDRYLRTR